MSAATPYTRKLIALTLAEFDAFHEIQETEEPLRSRIDEYCTAIGITPPDDIDDFPWSATFVSWCIKTAGAMPSEFKFSAAHAVFVKAAIANADAETGVFRARPVDVYGPKVGDLIHRNRSGGRIKYDQARSRADYASHSAIVVELIKKDGAGFAVTIGGNEGNSIRRQRVPLTSDGLVRQTVANPYISIVENLKVDVVSHEMALADARYESREPDETRVWIDNTGSLRMAMAGRIVDFEARRDSLGRIVVFPLKPEDGGGRYEVAGINERYHKEECDQLVELIRAGRQAEAERRAAEFIALYTDGPAGWTHNAGVEFYLRDSAFNRGPGGAAWILQKALGVPTDRQVGPITLAALHDAETRPRALLDALRAARETYERLKRDEHSIFWKGLVNRWNKARDYALTLLEGPVDAHDRAEIPVPYRFDPSVQPFKLRAPADAKDQGEPLVHIIREGVRCDTDARGHATPDGRSPLEIVVDASGGFIPLWAPDTMLRWRFHEASFLAFDDPQKAKTAVERLFAAAVLEWGSAAPVKFTKNSDAWDFEIVMRQNDNCNSHGCVLASAYFPDAGRHELVLYPKIFEQEGREQVETLIHEIGHIFGLRHFFAQVSETAWPSEIFGSHRRFSIMNYGEDSRLTAEDKADLRKLYQLVWAGKLTHINGTPIKLVKPYHATGRVRESLVVGLQREADFDPIGAGPKSSVAGYTNGREKGSTI